jgi:hypothetical protein
MPSYIICSNDKENLGFINSINLCPYFSTTYATIQLANLSTIANIQVLHEDDYVEFTTHPMSTTARLEMGNQQGMSYDTLPNLINTFLPRQCPRLSARLNSERKLVFVDDVDYADSQIEISYMTYNFRILLGYHGSTFPIPTSETISFGDVKSPKAKFVQLESAEFDFPIGTNADLSGRFWQTKLRDVQSYCSLPVIIHPEKAVDYRFEYSLNFFGGKVFCSILPATGTITVFPYVPQYDENNKELFPLPTPCHYCDVTCKIFEGKATENPKITLLTRFYSPDPTVGTDETWFDERGDLAVCQIVGKKKLFFGEATRISLQPLYDIHGSIAGNNSPLILPQFRVSSSGWRIETSSTSVLFYDNRSMNTMDNFNSVLIQAESKVGVSTIACDYEIYLAPWEEVGAWRSCGTARFQIEVISPTVEIIERQIVPPMVGSGLSTSVLYLISNCGTQCHRNTFGELEGILSPALVSSIIQNAFSPSFPLQAGSDIVGTIPTASLSNLFFKLVDANFYPIKLMSPMYLTLSVNSTEVPHEDLKDFVGKLPKDQPTPEQAQQIAQQQAEEQQKQQEQQNAEGILQRALSTIVEQQKQQEALQQQQMQMQSQQQAVELAERGIDINQIQGATGSVETGQEIAPPPTDEEILEQQQEQTLSLLPDDH